MRCCWEPGLDCETRDAVDARHELLKSAPRILHVIVKDDVMAIKETPRDLSTMLVHLLRDDQIMIAQRRFIGVIKLFGCEISEGLTGIFNKPEHDRDPRVEALRSGYATVARAYRENLLDELAGSRAKVTGSRQSASSVVSRQSSAGVGSRRHLQGVDLPRTGEVLGVLRTRPGPTLPAGVAVLDHHAARPIWSLFTWSGALADTPGHEVEAIPVAAAPELDVDRARLAIQRQAIGVAWVSGQKQDHVLLCRADQRGCFIGAVPGFRRRSSLNTTSGASRARRSGEMSTAGIEDNPLATVT